MVGKKKNTIKQKKTTQNKPKQNKPKQNKPKEENQVSLLKNKQSLQLNHSCNLGYVVQEHLAPLMQMLSTDITDYNMKIKTTKCLNTAVMMMFFFLGQKGVKIADQCEVSEVKRRHRDSSIPDNNMNIMKELKKDLLNSNHKDRYLYYIITTDGYFPYKDGRADQAFFPGHVFVLEKYPFYHVKQNSKKNIEASQGKPYYYMYQSYINQYDMKGHIQKNGNTLLKTYDDMKYITDELEHVVTNNEWDQRCRDFWNYFTYVDTEKLLTSKPRSEMFLCYRKVKVNSCVNVFQKYLRDHLDKIDVEINNHYITDNNVYKSDRLYNSYFTPKTSSELKKNIIKVLKELYDVIP